MLKAKDIMTADVVSVKNDAPISEAISLLIENNVTGIPVVQSDLSLVGILTEKDVLKLVYTKEDVRNKLVCDLMTTPPVHFDENDSLLNVCDCLICNHFRRVPVTSKGKLVGIISRPDVIRYVSKLKRESNLATPNREK
ncbi:MAG: CBS domain-containing protein [Planctomycetota bacterium]|nr:MAG: CBS domain-containing protein [Planctomycetota bacterium]